LNTAPGSRVRAKPFEVLLDQDRIARRIEELGRQISADYKGKKPVLVGVLKGCIVFLADLMRHLTIPVELEFVTAASYRNGIQPESEVVVGGEYSIALNGRHVLIVEGIVDSGRTASLIIERISRMEPASVELVTLLDKPNSHRVDVSIKYRGFSIGNEFVIGFGMDNAQQYRNLPYIGRVIES
jgi:hypoxanthine phosphoribosyltransferase